MIGGATTSKAHTAVKIAPEYAGTVVHVNDASKAVTVASNLLQNETSETYKQNIKQEYDTLREGYLNRSRDKKFLSLNEARQNKLKINWEDYKPTKPKVLGIQTIEVSTQELVDYIDWTPFFQAWELHGKYPNILTDELVGEQATELFNDAQQMLKKITKEQWFQPKAVFGLFPAHQINHDDIQVYDENYQPKEVFLTLRQQTEKANQVPNIALADFIMPKNDTVYDYVGCFCVTVGNKVEEIANNFKKKQDDYNEILVKALADRFAEAFAEYLHLKVRKDFWGYTATENLDTNQLIKEEYQGIRPAPGYPACPDHLEKPTIFKLLEIEKNINVQLTESMAMTPASTVSGYYFAHPQSKYFGLGKINQEQLTDYAQRRNITLEEATKWLNPLL